MTDEERRERERRAGYCHQHDQNTSDIHDIKTSLFEEIKPLVYRQSGQWKVLMLVFVVFMVSIWSYSTNIGEKLDDVVENTRATQLTVSEYMAAHIQESKDGFRRIKSTEKDVNLLKEISIDHERRLQMIENAK